jgi:hypothetical protein
MKTLKRLSKRAIEFCELCGYDVDKVKKNMRSECFAIERLETVDEIEMYNTDRSYPYYVYNPFNFKIEKTH